jgi:hypothetical protein
LDKKEPSDYFYDRFAFYRKLVKNTIKFDWIRWLKSTYNNLKSQPQYFWKCVSSFRKHISGSIQLEVDGTHLVKPNAVAGAFAKHFNLFIIVIVLWICLHQQTSEFLSLAPISDTEVCKVIKRLKRSKSVGLDDIPDFIIKDCSGIFIPILRHIFNLSLTQQYFPAVWKEAAVVPVYKRGDHAAVSNYRPNSILNIFSKVCEFSIHDHVLHYEYLIPINMASSELNLQLQCGDVS